MLKGHIQILILASTLSVVIIMSTIISNLHVNSVKLGVLTDHERILFREYLEGKNLAQDMSATNHELTRHRDLRENLRSKKSQILASCGGSISCVDLARIKLQQNRLADIPPCYTPENCSDFAQSAGYFGEATNSSEILPIYDKDGPEIIAAMQKQDNMILDVKQDRELRAKQGKNAPALKPVTCGSECFDRKGVWCCRRTW